MYAFVKMSSKWYCREFSSIAFAATWAEEHVESGEIVVFADDVEWFASEMNVDQDEIEMV
jgi:hypothetical protein